MIIIIQTDYKEEAKENKGSDSWIAEGDLATWPPLCSREGAVLLTLDHGKPQGLFQKGRERLS